jgi:hypothetical protein
VTPTPAAFGLTLAVFALTFGAICALVTPARLAGSLGDYLPRSTQDAEGFATREALRLSMDAAEPPPRLRIISNSVLAHAFASEEELTAALAAATGARWSVSMLTTPLQGAIDEAALAEHATARGPAVVVLAVGFPRFAARRERLIELDRSGRVGVRSAWADDALAAIGGTPRARTGVYAIDNRNFLLRNATAALGRTLIGRPAKRRVDIYVSEALPPDELAQRRVRMLGQLAAAERSTLGVALLERLVVRLRAGGSTVLLVEEPISDALFRTPGERARYDRYLTWSAATAQRLGARYCRPAAVARPVPRAMPDFIHVTDAPTQARLRAALADCVAAKPRLSENVVEPRVGKNAAGA